MLSSYLKDVLLYLGFYLKSLATNGKLYQTKMVVRLSLSKILHLYRCFMGSLSLIRDNS